MGYFPALRLILRHAGSLRPTPDVFAVVMATGILSVAAGEHSYPRIDGVLGTLAASSSCCCVSSAYSGWSQLRLDGALRSQAAAPWLVDAMHPAILVLWVGASAWIPVLLSAEIWRLYRRPDSVHFAGVWWSAVFPLGMYSTATQATAQALHLPVLSTVSLVVFWVGLILWVLVAAGFVQSTVRGARGTPRRG